MPPPNLLTSCTKIRRTIFTPLRAFVGGSSQPNIPCPPARVTLPCPSHFHVLPENMDLRSNQPNCVIHILHFHVLPENMDLRPDQPNCVIHVLHFHVLPENMDLRSKKFGLRGGECDKVWVIPYWVHFTSKVSNPIYIYVHFHLVNKPNHKPRT
jgi:hypothetical protein